MPKIIKRLLFTVAALILLVAVPFLIINLSDSAIRPAAAQLLEKAHTTQDVPDNAYYALIGFRLPGTGSPESKGHALIKEIRSMPLGRRDDYVAKRLGSGLYLPPGADCTPGNQDCLSAYKEKRSKFDAVLNQHRGLLSQYREVMIKYHNFRQLGDAPSWADSLISINKLYLFEVGDNWNAGRRASALNGLSADTAFWRLILRNSSDLLTKMVATANLAMNYHLTEELIGSCHECKHMKQFLAILTPLDHKAMDFTPVFKGEFVTDVSLLKQGTRNGKRPLSSPIDYFFHEDKTINAFYALERDKIRIAKADNKSIDQVAAAIDKKYDSNSYRWWIGLYVRPVSKIMASILWISPLPYIKTLRRTDAFRRDVLRKLWT